MAGKAKQPDVGVLPDSSKVVNGERVGIKDSGYLDKKGTTGADTLMLSMPPGMNIENQKLSDQHEMPMKTVTSLGYPGDGWT
jgi:hypothetical protein